MGPASVRDANARRARAVPETLVQQTLAIDRISARTVVAAVVAYVVLLMVLRLSLSPYLEIDEAQFFGQVDFRLVYANSHPPLYNWVLRLVLEATGWNWPLSVALVKGVLLAAIHLLVFDAARRIGGVPAGIGALAVAALCPQISWMAAHTLAHTVMVMAGCAGIVHAAVVIWQRPRALAFVWLGVAASIAMLAKFNGAILLGAAAVVALSTPERRAAAWRHRGGVALAAVVFAVLTGPSLVAAGLAIEASTGRLSKLFRPTWASAGALPGVGSDGASLLTVGARAWGAAALGILALTAQVALPGPLKCWRNALVATVAVGFGATLVGVLVSDGRQMPERYLSPFFMPLPVAAGLALTAFRWRAVVRLAGGVAFVAVPIGVAGMVLFDKHRFAYPHGELALAIAPDLPEGTLAVWGGRPDFAANMTLALRRAGRMAHAAEDRMAPGADHVLIVWQGGEVPGSDEVDRPFDECRPGPVATRPYRYFSGRTLSVATELCRPRSLATSSGPTETRPL